MLILADMENDCFMVVARSPKDAMDVDSKEWVTATTEGTDGKSIGKNNFAQSQVPGFGLIDSFIAKASQYVPMNRQPTNSVN